MWLDVRVGSGFCRCLVDLTWGWADLTVMGRYYDGAWFDYSVYCVAHEACRIGYAMKSVWIGAEYGTLNSSMSSRIALF